MAHFSQPPQAPAAPARRERAGGVMASPTAYFSVGVAALLRRAPYYATVLAALIRRPIDQPGVTLAVSDDGFLYYSPTFIATLTVPQLATAIEHELGHVLFRSSARGKAIGAETPHARTVWNFATDCAINETLRGMQDRELGKTWLVPETFKLQPGQTAEIYYRQLCQQIPSTPPAQPQSGGQGVGSGECGSCSGGNKAAIEQDKAVRGNAQGRTEIELDLARRQTAREAMAHAKTRGSVPAGLLRWAEGLLAPPAVNWRAKLARLVRASATRAAGAFDLDWRKPSRRQSGVGYGAGRPVMAAYVHRIPRVAVIVDTSGSMSRADLARALSELHGITQAIGAAVEFLAIDAALQTVTEVRNAKDAARLLRGGGGTDMKPAIDALQTRPRAQRPDIAICLTDGYVGDIGAKPSFPFIWVQIGADQDVTFAWGAHVRVETAAK